MKFTRWEWSTIFGFFLLAQQFSSHPNSFVHRGHIAMAGYFCASETAWKLQGGRKRDLWSGDLTVFSFEVPVVDCPKNNGDDGCPSDPKFNRGSLSCLESIF